MADLDINTELWDVFLVLNVHEGEGLCGKRDKVLEGDCGHPHILQRDPRWLLLFSFLFGSVSFLSLPCILSLWWEREVVVSPGSKSRCVGSLQSAASSSNRTKKSLVVLQEKKKKKTQKRCERKDRVGRLDNRKIVAGH